MTEAVHQPRKGATIFVRILLLFLTVILALPGLTACSGPARDSSPLPGDLAGGLDTVRIGAIDWYVDHTAFKRDGNGNLSPTPGSRS